MAEQQSFGNAINLVDRPAPRNYGSDLGDGLRAISGSLGVMTGLKETRDKQRADKAAAQTQQDLAQGYLYQEEFKREEPLSEAVEAGYLTQQQATNFSVSEADSLAALNQAERQGMKQSVRAALERSVRYQHAAMRNPGAAKELAEAYGIGDNGVENRTLDALEKIEQKNLQSDADYIRKRAQEEGITDFQNLDNEDVLDMWEGSMYAKRERDIRQNQRKALAHESTVAERTPYVAKVLNTQVSEVARGLDQLRLSMSGRLGDTGNDLGYPEAAQLLIQDAKQQIAVQYSDFPQLVKTHHDTLDQLVSSSVKAISDGQQIQRSQYDAEVTVPLRTKNLKLEIEDHKFEVSENPKRAVSSALSLNKKILDFDLQLAKAKDENNSLASANPAVTAVLANPLYQTELPLYNAMAADSASLQLQKISQPQVAEARDAFNMSIGVAEVHHTNPNADTPSVYKNLAKNYGIAKAYGADASPTHKAMLNKSIKHLVSNDNFVKWAKTDTASRQLLQPVAEIAREEVKSYISDLIEPTVTDKVAFDGLSSNTPASYWTNAADYIVLDAKATDSTGVPQFKLREGVSNELTVATVAKHQALTDQLNAKSSEKSDPQLFNFLKAASGRSSVSEIALSIIRSQSGQVLSSLDPDLIVPTGDDSAAVADEVRAFFGAN